VRLCILDLLLLQGQAIATLPEPTMIFIKSTIKAMKPLQTASLQTEIPISIQYRSSITRRLG